MKQPRTLRAVLLLFFLTFLAVVLYTLFDNQRFVVVEQEVVIDGLPAAFDGFRILQISDLHGSSFGENQAGLIAAVNQIDYDMIAFTGDMNDSTLGSESLEDSRAVLNLLDGMIKKAPMFWVDGNTGPHAIQTLDGVPTGQLTAVGRVIQQKGCIILMSPQAITRGDETIWITPELSEIAFQGGYAMFENERWLAAYGTAEAARSFLDEAQAAFRQINGNSEVKILLTHAPKQTDLSDEQRLMIGELDYDLILAGHYHGGQLRLPLIGAVYIPSPTSGILNSGIFPTQTGAKGLGFYGSVHQYVSAGLGASGHVQWLRFRLFNTPEINLVTIRRR